MVDFLDRTTTAGPRSGRLPPSWGPVSGADPRQRPLAAVAFDAPQLALQPAEAGRRVVVLVARVGQVPAHHVEGLPELVEVSAEAAEPRLDLLGVPLDPE